MEGRRAGKPLANGLRAIIWSLAGDAEYLVMRLGLPRYGTKKSPCGLCRCSGDSQSADSWTDCRTNAPWLALGWKREEWIAWSERPQCSIFSIFSHGLTVLNVHYTKQAQGGLASEAGQSLCRLATSRLT